MTHFTGVISFFSSETDICFHSYLLFFNPDAFVTKLIVTFCGRHWSGIVAVESSPVLLFS